MRAVVFGATPSAAEIHEKIKEKYEIIAYCDNDSSLWGGVLDNCPVVNPETVLEFQWDEIIIISISSMNAIKKQLLDMGISEAKINTTYVEAKVKNREQFIRDFAKIIYHNDIRGSVAEAGVFQGECASIINASFPDRKCYLFDTFEGFDERDIIFEAQNKFSNAETGHLNITSEALVLGKMKYPDKCFIKKGYFPESAEGVEDNFVYVNLDMDLYKPTIEGLRFFYPLMVQGGIITVHDFFSKGYEGVNAAVYEFLGENPMILPFPIGDGLSVAIQKR